MKRRRFGTPSAVGLALALAVLASALAPAPARAGDPALLLPAEVPAAERERLETVAEEAAVSTSIRAKPFVARRDLFEYLLDHPEFSAHVARTLKLARYRVRQTSEGLFMEDGWGATGHFWIVSTVSEPQGRGGRRVMYARGQYEKPLLPDIRGQAVVLIEYEADRGVGDKSRITTAVTGYVKLDSPIIALLSKLAGPIATAKADLEARRLVEVFAKTTAAIEAAPAAVYERLRKSPEVPRRELEELRRLLSLP